MISQPALSKQIRLLERSLKVTLFDRHPRGMRLTAAGQTLAGYSRRIFALDAEAVRALEELRGFQRGRLAIGASTTIGVYLLPEVFVAFRQRYPNVQTTLEVANSRTIQQRLADHALDVGFTEVKPDEEKDYILGRFMSDDLVAIAPPGHPLLRSKRISLESFLFAAVCCSRYRIGNAVVCRTTVGRERSQGSARHGLGHDRSD